MRPVALLAVPAAMLLLSAPGGAAIKPRTGARLIAPIDYRPGDGYTAGSAGLGQRFCTESADVEGGAAFFAPIDVPDGAALTKLTVHYLDFDADLALHFVVAYTAVGLTDHLAGFPEADSVTAAYPPSDNTPQSLTLTPPAPVALDNANRRYWVVAQFPACGTFVGSEAEENMFPSLLLDVVRVEYQLR